MKKVISFLFLLSFLTACAAPTSTPEQTSVVENTALPTFTPIPALTAEIQAAIQSTADLPTLTPSVALAGELNIIQFKANGTYTDITDSLAFGSSKTYSINAMKGQIMSVSILPQIPDGGWGYIPIQVKGADGSVLCPQSTDSECMFWRGVLPSSQDYYVTLTPNGDVPQFVMRVAINPPGQELQYFQYNNPATDISLTYPDTFAPALPVVGNYKTDPELTLNLIDTASYEKTNLSEAYLFISSTSDSQVVGTCTEPNESGGGPEQVIGEEVINGYTFVHSTSDGAGAGNYYQQEIFRMVNNGVCYEVIYFMHSTNVGNYPAGTVAEFNRDALMQKFNNIFSTFSIQ